MAYDAESERILTAYRARMQQVTDTHTRAITQAWVNAWDDLAPELTASLDELVALTSDGEQLRRSQITKARRLRNALALIEQRLERLGGDSARLINAQMRDLVRDAGVMTDAMISSQLPPGTNVDVWARVDAGQVDAIVQRTTGRITARSYALAPEATASMRRELVRGMLVGANPREAARRMVARSQSTFNGGLARAMTIARTEMLDAQRRAAQISERGSTDLLAGWIWTAALSARTCSACWGMHGQEFPLTQAGPEGHQNCRCTRVPRTKTWAELGFDIPEPRSLLPDGDARFDALAPGDQLAILGPTKYSAWQAGDFPRSSWATKRSTDGWRDSWVPAKVPAA